MKTTVEIPDELFREAKCVAARRGQTFRQFLTDAISDRLRAFKAEAGNKPWMRHYGVLADLTDELERVQRLVEAEFESVDPKDWA